MVILHEAVQSFLRGRGKFRDVEQALEEGADPNEGEGDETPLRSAIKANQARLVQLLIRRKVDLDKQDAKGVGPLHTAVFKGRSHLVKLLLDGGANANLKDIQGQTPIFFVPTRHICELLLSRRAELVLTNLKGQTPLHHASHAGLVDVVAWFVEVLGAKHLDVEDAHGKTPLTYAERSKVTRTSSRLQYTLQKSAQAVQDHSEDAAAAAIVATSTIAALAEDADDSLVRDLERVDGAESSFHSQKDPEPEQPAAETPAEVSEAATQQDDEKLAMEAVAEQAEAAIGIVEPLATLEAVDEGDKGSDGLKMETHMPDQCWYEGILLTAFVTPEEGYTCSISGREFPEGTLLYGNRDEDFDVSPECLFNEDGSSSVKLPDDGDHTASYTASDLDGEAPDDDEGSFASEQLFAEEARAQIEEDDGCLYWQVLLKKEEPDDKLGFVQANGQLDFETRLAQKASGEAGSSKVPGPEVLIVRRIHLSGLLQRWNERVAELEVKPQDRIIGVNDETTVDGMMAEIHGPRIMLQMMRFPERFIVTLSKEVGGRLGFKFERPQNIHSEEVRVTEILEEGCMMAYNVHQANAGRYAYIVLPDMRIDRVNDCWGDPEAIAKELKDAQIVDLHIRRCETSLVTPAQLAQKMKVMNSVTAAFKSSGQSQTRSD
eukprot:CAMPEP_0197639854 /NCGR_PEP_ID=MMETSP1338-20131121/14348_1 /TAXON_ID=43686 ORGANISM="Pelagodinium beii, Strain RCC1491" /NCGR_SAMPLE_ID=MMETSP1338 /ASSEMBLY_ACC=CAM_ASM_000754 /LENGTH=659 /DNA_ID=CAMNT_0043212635 /DNA_START=71 /DNA_END=2050 /DNA_ORIENTATION=-